MPQDQNMSLLLLILQPQVQEDGQAQARALQTKAGACFVLEPARGLRGAPIQVSEPHNMLICIYRASKAGNGLKQRKATQLSAKTVKSFVVSEVYSLLESPKYTTKQKKSKSSRFIAMPLTVTIPYGSTALPGDTTTKSMPC